MIVADVDEIPRHGAIEQVLREGAILPTRYAFEMKAYWYFPNLEHSDSWTKAAMARRAHLIDVNQFRLFGEPWITPPRQPKRLAKTIKYFGSPMRWKTVPDGGWHFTFMKGPEAVREKLFHYSHVTPDEMNTLGTAQARIDNALSGPAFTIREVGEQFPAYLRRNPGRFSHMLASTAVSPA